MKISLTPESIRRNYREYLKRKNDHLPTRTDSSKRRKLSLFDPSVALGFSRDVRCINPDCGASSTEFQDLPSHGTTVCTLCGTLQQTMVFQELDPFYWRYAQSHSTDITCSDDCSSGLSSYRPKFHWNEDEKLRRMIAPEVPKFNKLVIFKKLREMGYNATNLNQNFKEIVQKACGLIDKEHKISLYSRKWGEHWISLVKDFTHGNQHPPLQSQDDRYEFFNYFISFWKAWPMCCDLLSGSKKGSQRRQLPQYRWTFRQLLITFRPGEYDTWRPWLYNLSQKKERELDVFWKRVCFVNGWPYKDTFSFISKTKHCDLEN